MAVVMPFVGYAIYLVLSRRASLTSTRRPLAAGIGAYVGLNAAALCAAIEFGIQPDLFYKTGADGHHIPLYAPFHLSQSIPAMLFAHVVVAGVVDGALTAGVVAYLQKANRPVLRINHGAVPETDAEIPPRKVGVRGIVVGLVAMVVLVPLGLVATGTAFGEDAPDELDLKKYGLHAVPTGLSKYTDWWSHSLLPGYDFKRGGHPTVGYYVSAVAGTALIAGVLYLAFRVVQVVRRRRGGADPDQLEPELRPSASAS
jgi:cobalt/nickel transport system permease protein